MFVVGKIAMQDSRFQRHNMDRDTNTLTVFFDALEKCSVQLRGVSHSQELWVLLQGKSSLANIEDRSELEIQIFFCRQLPSPDLFFFLFGGIFQLLPLIRSSIKEVCSHDRNKDLIAMLSSLNMIAHILERLIACDKRSIGVLGFYKKLVTEAVPIKLR